MITNVKKSSLTLKKSQVFTYGLKGYDSSHGNKGKVFSSSLQEQGSGGLTDMSNPRKLKLCAETLGRRKNAVCHVQMYAGLGHIYINGKPAYDYFQNQTSLLQIVLKPILTVAHPKDFTFDVQVYGGGLVSQAYAVQLGLSRAYIKSKPVYRGLLKQGGLLTRDPREKERKKYGLKKARKSPQFSKR